MKVYKYEYQDILIRFKMLHRKVYVKSVDVSKNNNFSN